LVFVFIAHLLIKLDKTMKQLFLTLFLVIASALSYKASAVNPNHPPLASYTSTLSPQMTINDFVKMDIKGLRKADGNKLKWGQRIALGMAQKNFAKKIKKGKMDGTASLDTALAPGSNNIHGLLSIIFAFTGLFIPILGFGLLIAALVLGIIGIKKDANPTMAIIGTVVSGVFILLVLVALAVIASGCWLYC
jgi:hypothetical protein